MAATESDSMRRPIGILNQTGIRRILKFYFDCYQRSRTHPSLAKDAPVARPIQLVQTGPILAIPEVWRVAPSLCTNCRLGFLNTNVGSRCPVCAFGLHQR